MGPMPSLRPVSRLPAFVLAAGAFVCALASVSTPAGAVGLSRLEFAQESVKTSGQSFVTGMGFRAHLAGGDLNNNFVVVPAIEYWRDTDRLEELGIPKAEQKDFSVGADLRYRFGDGKSWTPYGGAGLGLHVVKSYVEIALPGIPAQTKKDSGTKLAPNFLVGVDLPAAGPIRNAVELNWALVPDLKQFKINLGIGYEFGGKEKPIEQ